MVKVIKMQKLKRFLFINLGCILLSVGIYFFKIPNGFVTGGVSGIGTLLGKITYISPTVWIWILNIALLLLGFLFLGWQNSFKTLPDAESHACPITVAWERKHACCFKLAVGLSSSNLIAQELGLRGFPRGNLWQIFYPEKSESFRVARLIDVHYSPPEDYLNNKKKSKTHL